MFVKKNVFTLLDNVKLIKFTETHVDLLRKKLRNSKFTIG